MHRPRLYILSSISAVNRASSALLAVSAGAARGRAEEMRVGVPAGTPCAGSRTRPSLCDSSSYNLSIIRMPVVTEVLLLMQRL